MIYKISDASISRTAQLNFSELTFAGNKGKRTYSLGIGILPALTDNFDRANSSTISTATIPWEEITGDWEILSNRLSTSSSPSTNPITTVKANIRNAITKIGKGQSGWGWGVAFWVTDSSNWYMAVTQQDTVTTYSCPSGGTLVGTTCTYPASYAATATTETSAVACWNGGYLANGYCNYCPYGSPVGETGYCTYQCQPWPAAGCGCGPPNNTPTENGCIIPVASYAPYSYTYTAYSCPNGGSVSGSTCVYPANYSATATNAYANKILVKRAIAGTVTTVATSTGINTSSSSARPSYVQVSTVSETATITAPIDDSSGTINLVYNAIGETRGKKHGVALSSTTGTPATTVDNFEYTPL